MIALWSPCLSASVNPTLPTEDLTVFPDSLVPRIGLRLADGSFSTDSVVNMTNTEHGYEADVSVRNGGFRFYAPNTSMSDNESDWVMTWYTLADFAVNPPLEYYLNPLYLSHADEAYSYVPIPDGDYHVYYFDQLDNGQHYNLFTYTPADGGGEVGFPPAVYLINMMNDGIEIAESDEPGIYKATIDLPAPDFKVSFQKQGYWIPGFIFGPVDASVNSLYSYEKIPIAFGTNTMTALIYDADPVPTSYALEEGMKARVTVDLSGPDNFIRITNNTLTGVDVSENDVQPVTAVRTYNLQGFEVEGRSWRGPAVRVYSDGSVSKTIL